jgi:hypothetical protein
VDRLKQIRTADKTDALNACPQQRH